MLQSEASDVAKEGANNFSFKLHSHKHIFQASNNTERDGWVVATEKAVEEAKAAKEAVTGSDEYKSAIEKLGKFCLNFWDVARQGKSNVPVAPCVSLAPARTPSGPTLTTR